MNNNSTNANGNGGLNTSNHQLLYKGCDYSTHLDQTQDAHHSDSIAFPYQPMQILVKDSHETNNSTFGNHSHHGAVQSTNGSEVGLVQNSINGARNQQLTTHHLQGPLANNHSISPHHQTAYTLNYRDIYGAAATGTMNQSTASNTNTSYDMQSSAMQTIAHNQTQSSNGQHTPVGLGSIFTMNPYSYNRSMSSSIHHLIQPTQYSHVQQNQHSSQLQHYLQQAQSQQHRFSNSSMGPGVTASASGFQPFSGHSTNGVLGGLFGTQGSAHFDHHMHSLPQVPTLYANESHLDRDHHEENHASSVSRQASIFDLTSITAGLRAQQQQNQQSQATSQQSTLQTSLANSAPSLLPSLQSIQHVNQPSTPNSLNQTSNTSFQSALQKLFQQSQMISQQANYSQTHQQLNNFAQAMAAKLAAGNLTEQNKIASVPPTNSSGIQALNAPPSITHPSPNCTSANQQSFAPQIIVSSGSPQNQANAISQQQAENGQMNHTSLVGEQILRSAIEEQSNQASRLVKSGSDRFQPHQIIRSASIDAIIKNAIAPSSNQVNHAIEEELNQLLLPSTECQNLKPISVNLMSGTNNPTLDEVIHEKTPLVGYEVGIYSQDTGAIAEKVVNSVKETEENVARSAKNLMTPDTLNHAQTSAFQSVVQQQLRGLQTQEQKQMTQRNLFPNNQSLISAHLLNGVLFDKNQPHLQGEVSQQVSQIQHKLQVVPQPLHQTHTLLGIQEESIEQRDIERLRKNEIILQEQAQQNAKGIQNNNTQQITEKSSSAKTSTNDSSPKISHASSQSKAIKKDKNDKKQNIKEEAKLRPLSTQIPIIIKHSTPQDFQKEADLPSQLHLQPIEKRQSSSLQPEDTATYSTKVAICLLKPPFSGLSNGASRNSYQGGSSQMSKPMSSNHSEMELSPRRSGGSHAKHSTDPHENREAANNDVQQKHRKIITKCPHSEEQYYANGMCKNCYHSKGRTKLATQCEHNTRALYAKGVCKNCYLSIYHKRKRVNQPKNAQEENNSQDEQLE